MRLNEITDPLLPTLLEKLLDAGTSVYFNVTSVSGKIQVINPDYGGNHRRYENMDSGEVGSFGKIKDELVFFLKTDGVKKLLSVVRLPYDEVDNLLTLKKTSRGWELTNAAD